MQAAYAACQLSQRLGKQGALANQACRKCSTYLTMTGIQVRGATIESR